MCTAQLKDQIVFQNKFFETSTLFSLKDYKNNSLNVLKKCRKIEIKNYEITLKKCKNNE